MLTISGSARVFFYSNPTDMRKSFEGLSAIVEKEFDILLTSGAYFVFLNRAKNRIKVLYWDIDGLALWYKRLEKGKFIPASLNGGLITRQDFFLLLEGIIPQKKNRRFKS